MPYTIKPGSFKYKKSNGQFSEIDCFEGPDLTEEVAALEKGKAPIIIDSATGNPIVIKDGADGLPVEGMKIHFAPKQDLHGYDNPWPAGGGKNKFPITLTTQTKNGTTFTVSDDGSITISGTPSELTRVALNQLSVTSENNMKFSMTGNATGIRVFCSRTKDGTTTYPTLTPSITMETGYTFTSFLLEVTTTFSGSAVVKFQMEDGTTVTDWTPYSNICPISGWNGVEVYNDPVYSGTIEWNQHNIGYRNQGTFFNTTYGDIQNGVAHVWGEWGGNSGAQFRLTNSDVSIPNGHIILVDTGRNDGLLYCRLQGGTGGSALNHTIITINTNNYVFDMVIGINKDKGEMLDFTFIPQIFDLTAMFGAGNEPSTFEEFRTLFPKDYYPYNEGEQTCVSAVNGDIYRHTSVTFPAKSKNLLDSATPSEEGKAFGLSGGNPAKVSNSGWDLSNYIPVIPGESYVYSGMITYNTNTTIVEWSNSNKEFISYQIITNNSISTNGAIMTAPEGASYCRVTYKKTDISENTLQYEKGSSRTAYEPFDNTIYGGTLDAVSGVLIVDRMTIDLGTLSYTYRAATDTKPIPRFAASITNGKDGLPLTEICSYYKTHRSPVYAGDIDYSLCVYNSSVYILDSRYTSVSDFKAAVSGVKLVYELATPIEIQLNPITVQTFLGDNTIWSDINGNIELNYRADTKLFCQKNDQVNDVQINGASILDAQGVANVPIANSTNEGVVKADAYYGIDMVTSGTDINKLRISKATTAQAKAGVSNYKPITPGNQHESVFYGLAKLAGADMSASSNAIGTFTPEAIVAIQKMLGVRPKYGDIEFIKEVTLTEDMDTVSVVTDMNGLPFKLANAQIVLMFGTEATGINDYISATIFDENGLPRGLPTLKILQSSFTWLVYDFIQFGGLPMAFAKATSTGNSQTAQLATFHVNTPSDGRGGTQSIQYITGVKFSKYSETTTPIISGSRVVIYGNRIIED